MFYGQHTMKKTECILVASWNYQKICKNDASNPIIQRTDLNTNNANLGVLRSKIKLETDRAEEVNMNKETLKQILTQMQERKKCIC